MSQTELLLGDPAPEIRVETFLKGEPILHFVPGTVYVVEFWATWCGPCKTSIPHLTALQARYPQVPIIGVAVTWKDLGELTAFVHEQGAAMDYRVAVDAPPEQDARRGAMHGSWCEAAYQQGIPTAFIVDCAGRIAWIGHPMEIDAPLAAVIDGTWDLPEKAKAHRDELLSNNARERRALERALAERLAAADQPGAILVYGEAFAAHPVLERSHGFGRLKLLMSSGDAALGYARHLIEHVVSGDINTLFKIGMALTEQASLLPERLGEAFPNEAAAALAVEAIERAETLLDDAPQGALRLRLSQALAQALLASGNAAKAVLHARSAREAAVEVAAPERTIAELDALLARCEAAAPPELGVQLAVICDGDSCRLADA